MREIVLDTETTGFDPESGDRIIEIGCVEVFNHVPTGKTYWQYINGERDVPEEAVAVHGITTEFLKDKPVFSEIVGDFLDFCGDSALVIHNAEFDIKFLNWELKQLGFPQFRLKDAIDTLKIARKKFPGSPANLDALCRRFGIDNTSREFHGALLDAQLLAEVYLELNGGRQHGLGIDVSDESASDNANDAVKVERPFREPRKYVLNPDEAAAHDQLIETLGDDAIWNKIG